MKSTTLPARTRTWTFQPPAWANLGPVTETCPSFCRTDHSGDQRAHPEDVWHQQVGPSVRIRLSESEGKDTFLALRVLETQLTSRPHSPDPDEQVPHVAIEWAEGIWTDALDVDGVDEVIAKLSTFVDNLKIVRGQLVRALAEHQDGAQ